MPVSMMAAPGIPAGSPAIMACSRLLRMLAALPSQRERLPMRRCMQSGPPGRPHWDTESRSTTSLARRVCEEDTMNDTGRIEWRCHSKVEKYEADAEAYRAQYGEQEGNRRFYAEHQPYEILEAEGNLATET